jgi:fructoselysine 6-kinase
MDVVFMSASAEPQLSAEQMLELALDAGAPLAVVTLGGAGSVAASGASRWQAEAIRVAPVVDTLGAGDAYIAAFIAARLDGSGVERAMNAGARSGAAACRQWGLAGLIQTGPVPA